MSERCSVLVLNQRFCALTYGESPCQAALGQTGDLKCHNTDGTCQDLLNFTPTTLPLRFVRNQQGMLQYGPAVASLLDVRTTPASLNLGGMDDGASPLGQREELRVKLRDHKSSDNLVDKYRTERETGENSTYRAAPEFVGSTSATQQGPSNYEVDFTALDGGIDSRPREGDTVLLFTWSRLDFFDTSSGYEGVQSVGWNLAFSNDDLFAGSSVFEIWWKRMSETPDESVVMTGSTDVTSGTGAKSLCAVHVWRGLDESLPVEDVNELVDITAPADDPNPPSVVTATDNAVVLAGAFLVGDGTAPASISPGYEHFQYVAFEDTSGNPQLGVSSKSVPLAGSENPLQWNWGDSNSAADALQNIAFTVVLRAAETTPELYDPRDRGTYWGKWIARNPFYTAYTLDLYEGEVGQALENMRVRHYILEQVAGPNEGVVELLARDLFSKIEARKAVAPLPSTGELDAAIDNNDLAFTLTPAGIGDLEYPAAGFCVIGDEEIQFTRVGDAMTVVGGRGANNTDPEEHDEGALVQLVYVVDGESVQDIVYDLLTEYSEVPASAINKPVWDELAAVMPAVFTTHVTKPTPVADLIGELMEQAGCTFWVDVETNMVKFRPLRAGGVSPVVTEAAYILDGGTFNKKRGEDKRVTEVWVHYGMKNYVEDVDDEHNYHTHVVVADPDAAEKHGTPVARRVFSRWIAQGGRQTATDCGQRLLTMYKSPPLEGEFTVRPERLSDFGLAEYFFLECADVQDATGSPARTAVACVSVERNEGVTRLGFQQVVFAEDDDSDVRYIPIETNGNNLNLRTLHDALFAAPEGGSGGEVIRFEVLSGVVVGSTSTSADAMRTGSWPEGVTLSLDNHGHLAGRGGRGGNGGKGDSASTLNGSDGEDGGTALRVEYPITIDNTDGKIYGGGAGAGGGGAARRSIAGVTHYAGGAGGGSGAGRTKNSGGAGRTSSGGSPSPTNGEDGGDGSSTSGGNGGDGGICYSGIIEVEGELRDDARLDGGNGGDGGNAGQDGEDGQDASYAVLQADPNGITLGDGGSGGTRGAYVVGNTFVTWAALGDVRGRAVA